MRPVKLKVDGTLKGDSARIARGYWLGGKSGCDVMAYPIRADLTVGDRYVLFFSSVSDAVGMTGDDLVVGDAYRVAADGTVTRSVEQPIPLDTLKSQIRTGEFPTPTEPGPQATPTEGTGPG